jgi:GNAT superfamily N-acetyltransferase
VVAAFVDDPVFRYLFADGYAQQTAVFAGSLFDLRVGLGTIWLVDEGACVAMWAPPAPGGHAGELEPLDLPGPAACRLAEYEHAVGAILPTREHWYLGILATHPDLAGRGRGRLAMANGLAAAARDGVPCYLETASEVNVGIYQRRGWQVAETTTVGPLLVRVMSHQGR